MRFAEQNKKKIDPRYFLNEDIESDIAAAREMGAGQYRPNPALAFDPTQKAVSGTEKLVDPFYSQYSTLATKGKGFVKCPEIAGPIQAAALEIIKGVRPELVSTPALMKRLTDGKVGVTTLQMINVALNFAGKPSMPVNVKSFQQVCSFTPAQVQEIVGYMKQLPRQTAEKIAALSSQTAQTTGTDKRKESDYQYLPQRSTDPSITRIAPKVEKPVDTSKIGRGTLEESKARDASYNTLKEQKNKKLFEALIKG